MKLTPKQKAFADEYLKNGGNATEAARKAGYKKPNPQGSENLAKPSVLNYIAERQKEIEKQAGRDIMSLTEIQERRSKLAKGELKDDFGFSPDFSDQLKAMNDLEKALTIKEEKEAEKKALEDARQQGTYHIDLDVVADVFHPMIRDIRSGKHSEYVLPGGRGSTKSSGISLIIPELIKNNPSMHALILRKVGNTIKDSVYAQMKWAIAALDLEQEFQFKKSPFEIIYKPTGQKIYFRGADDPLKIKSIKPEFGYIGILWLEELDQFAGPEEVRSIQQSAIRGGDKAYRFKSFNPPRSKNNWANEYTEEAEYENDAALVVRSTYKDVPEEWLGEEFINEAEHLKEVNPAAYENEYEGVANGNGGNVFDYLELREITDEEISHMDKGYNDYCIICDSAEKKSVNDYRDLGVFSRAAVKGPGSVEYGMKWLQKRKIVIDRKRTPNAYEELTRYEYERDKDGNIISGYPDADNHIIDALRYAFEPVFMRRGTQA